MATKEELISAVKRELERWGWVSSLPGTYNTGYDGQYVQSQASSTKDDYESAVAELNSWAHGKSGKFRGAASLSGHGNNEWSILFEYGGKPQPSFNFHIRIK